MIWRLLHIVVLAALVLAAADVYKIKYESTLQAERVAKLRGELRREHDTIASLRAEWSKLDRPDRIQDLAQRHLGAEAAGDAAVRHASIACPSGRWSLCRPAPPIRSAP